MHGGIHCIPLSLTIVSLPLPMISMTSMKTQFPTVSLPTYMSREYFYVFFCNWVHTIHMMS
jgi:hypothetical protein